MQRPRVFTAYDIAANYVSLCDEDQAFEWLERAIEERAMTLVTLPFDPAFDDVRSDRRMKDIGARLSAPIEP